MGFWDWLRDEPDHEKLELVIDSTKDLVRVHLVFIGQVQGVGFRYVMMEASSIFDLTGVAGNMPDGTVDAYWQGNPRDIENAVGFVQCLSPYILVDDIRFEIVEAAEDEDEFLTF